MWSRLKISGFTVSDVLLTIGLIGVVAAILFPMFVEGYRNKVLKAQVKKTSNTIANGFRKFLAAEDVFTLDATDMAQCRDSGCVEIYMNRVFLVIAKPNEGAKNVPLIYKFEDGEAPVWLSDESDFIYEFVTEDGVIYGLKTFEPNPQYFQIIADVNGNSRPNTGAKDLCLFTIDKNGTLHTQCPAMEYLNPQGNDGGEGICGSNCTKCDSKNGRCKKCEKGFYPDGLSCKSCTEIPGCVHCNQVTGKCLEFGSGEDNYNHGNGNGSGNSGKPGN